MCGNELDGNYDLGAFDVIASIEGNKTSYEVSAVGIKGRGSTLAAALNAAAVEFCVAELGKNDPIKALRKDAGKLQDLKLGLPTFAGPAGPISPASEQASMSAAIKRDEAVKMLRDAAERDFVRYFCLPEGGFRDGAGDAISDVTAPMVGVVVSIVREWMISQSSGDERPLTLRLLLCLDILAQLGLDAHSVVRAFGVVPLDENEQIQTMTSAEFQ